MKTEYQSVLEEFMDHRQPLQMLQNKLISEAETKEPYSSLRIAGPRATQAFVRFLRKIARGGTFDPQHMQQKAGRSPCTGCGGKQKIDGKRCDVCKGNKLGMITSAGTGGAHDPPNITPEQAKQSLDIWARAGGVYSQLPSYANPPTSSVDAPRNRARRPSIVKGKLHRKALRHDGQAAVNKFGVGAGINARYDLPFQDVMPSNQSLGGSGRKDEPSYYYYPPASKRKWRKKSKKPKPPKGKQVTQADRAAKHERALAMQRRSLGRFGESTYYLSKTIDEEFCNSLEGVLGL